MNIRLDSPNWSAGRDTAAAIAETWNRSDAPGGAIVLFDADAIRAEAAGGLESLATGTPFGIDSVVRYASVTKHVFAACVLARPDLIGLDDRLGDHLAELRGDLAAVTVGRALDMTGGLPDVRDTLALLGIGVHASTEAAPILEFLGRLERLNYPAGSEVSYSNTGYRLVEAALARKGRAFDDTLRAEIAEPLGIAWRAPETWFDPVPGLVPGYWQGPTGWQLATAGLHLSASGSLTGSVRSLAIWLQTLLADRGPGAGVLAALSAPRRLADGRVTGYGLGLARTVVDGRTFVGHGGSHVGYKTHFLLDPATRVGVAIVSNREDTLAAGLAQQVMASLFGLDLPRIPHDLPLGLHVAPRGGDWLEVSEGAVTYIGATEALWRRADGASASTSSTLPIALRAVDGGVEGEIGHAFKRFVPIGAPETGDAVAGVWEAPEIHGRFEIADRVLYAGSGPTRTATPLVSLGDGRWLAEGRDGPWTKRFGLYFLGDEVDLTIHRSRVLRFHRTDRA